MMLRASLEAAWVSTAFGDCNGRKLVVCLGVDGANPFKARKPCNSASVHFDSSSHGPHSTNHIPPASRFKACPRLFNFLHQPPRIYSGRCLMYDGEAFRSLSTGDQHLASALK